MQQDVTDEKQTDAKEPGLFFSFLEGDVILFDALGGEPFLHVKDDRGNGAHVLKVENGWSQVVFTGGKVHGPYVVGWVHKEIERRTLAS